MQQLSVKDPTREQKTVILGNLHIFLGTLQRTLSSKNAEQINSTSTPFASSIKVPESAINPK